MRLYVPMVAVLLCLPADKMCAADASGPSDLRVTAMVDGSSLWRETRDVQLRMGINYLEFQQVALTIDGSSIMLRSPSERQFKLIETGLDFEYEVVPAPATGSSDRTVKKPANARILATVMSGSGAASRPELLYKVSGLRCDVRYMAFLNPDGNLDLKCRASVTNSCGIEIEEAALYIPTKTRSRRRSGSRTYSYPGQTQDNAEMIHSPLLLVPIPVSVRKEHTKNFELLSLPDLSFDRYYYYDGHPMVKTDTSSRSYRDSDRMSRSFSVQQARAAAVKIVYELDTTEAQVPRSGLPLSEAQVYGLETDEFCFEQGQMEHDRLSNSYRIVVGPHPDITGNRQQVAFKETQPRRGCEETMQVTLENNTAKAIEVRVREQLLRSSKYTIQKSSHHHMEVRPGLLEFRAAVEPNASCNIKYTVIYEY